MYTIISLLPLPGDNWSRPLGVNEQGRVVGVSESVNPNVHYSVATKRRRAVVWRSLPFQTIWGDLAIEAEDIHASLGNAAVWSEATDINDSGDIVGYWQNADEKDSPNGGHAFILVKGVASELPGLQGDIGSRAYSINYAGDVVGESIKYTKVTGGAIRAVRWPSGAGPLNLGHAAEDKNGNGEYWARAINNKGEICGMAFDERVPGFSIAANAFRWDSVNGLVLLQPLPGDTDTWAYAINGSATVVGQSGVAPYFARAAMWQVGKPPLELAGYEALGVNKQGQCVGAHWLWDDGTRHDLNHLIDPASGWVIRFATGINNRGQIIGSGDYRIFHFGSVTTRRAFLATPPLVSKRTIELEHLVGSLVGVHHDAGGWRWPRGGPPEPVPPWEGSQVPPALRGFVSALRVLREARAITDSGTQRKIEELARKYLGKELRQILRGIEDFKEGDESQG